MYLYKVILVHLFFYIVLETFVKDLTALCLAHFGTKNPFNVKYDYKRYGCRCRKVALILVLDFLIKQ